MDIFSFFEVIAENLTYSLFGFTKSDPIGLVVRYFIYDILKIGTLLILINYLMAISRYFFPLEKVRNLLSKRKWYGIEYFAAAILGVVTPFCSCSSIPLFIGFLSAGIPLGVTLSFLISSPLVNEASLLIFPSVFGWNAAIIYNLSGITIAVAGGFVIQKMGMEKYINGDLVKIRPISDVTLLKDKKSLPVLALGWWKESMEITKNIFPYLLIGITVGSLIHGFVPADFAEKYLSSKAWWAVPLATIAGVPFYANSVSVIPVMEALVGKGVPLGTALSFMTGIVTLSIPEAMILKKVMRIELLAVFFSVTVIGIMLIGYLFNWLY